MIENIKRQIREMPKEERLKEPTEAEILTTVRVLRYYLARRLRDNKDLPSELWEAVHGMGVQPAIEVIITDERGRYALARRSADDSETNKKKYGEQKLNIVGGFPRVSREGAERVGPMGTAVRMAREDTGLDVVPISGPIAMYQWTLTKEHPTGWPLSLVFVFKAIGGLAKPGVEWFEPDMLPKEGEVLKGNVGEMHRKFLEAYQEWRKNPNFFIDLNAGPLREKGSK